MQWFSLNLTQRVYNNSVEHLSFAIPTFLIAGLFYPRVTTFLGMTTLLGREVYTNSYLRQGPNSEARFAGGALLMGSEVIVLSILFFLAIWRGFLRKPLLNSRRLKRMYQPAIDQQMQKVLKDMKK